MSNTCRIGVGGPVGSGKTALIEAITPYFLKLGLQVLIITNDIVTTEDAKHVRKMLKGYLAEERIIGVETGACPHTAVREDPSMNIAAVEEMETKFPDSDVVLIESGGDNLTLTFSPALVDFFIYVIDVAAGALLEQAQAEQVAVEQLFFNRNTTTAFTVAQARGVLVLAAAKRGLPLAEYTPLQVKQAIVGYGRAEKQQIQYMVAKMLAMREIPRPDDAADALAIAICHAHYYKTRRLRGEESQ